MWTKEIQDVLLQPETTENLISNTQESQDKLQSANLLDLSDQEKFHTVLHQLRERSYESDVEAQYHDLIQSHCDNIFDIQWDYLANIEQGERIEERLRWQIN